MLNSQRQLLMALQQQSETTAEGQTTELEDPVPGAHLEPRAPDVGGVIFAAVPRRLYERSEMRD